MKVVGRSVESERIAERVEAARHGRAGALLVSGEAGIGKTTLLETAVRNAEDFTVLRARGIESEFAVPYASLLELLRPELARLEKLAPRLRSALAGALGLGPPAAGGLAVPGATAALLSALAEERPVLALVDDVQWVDEGSASAFAFAARRLHDVPLLTILSLREPLAPPLELDGIEQLRLAPLDDQAALELLAAHGLAPALCAQVAAEAAGNPLVLVELARAGAASAPEVQDVAERLFGPRVRTLDEMGQWALLTVALQEGCERNRLARIVGSEDALITLAEAGLVRSRQGRLELFHPLLRPYVLGMHDHSAQLRAHALLGQVLPDGYDRTRHRALAARGPDPALADELQELAQRNRNGAAVWALERSAELTHPGPERSRRFLAAAQAAFSARDVATAHRLVAAVDRNRPNGVAADAAELEASIMLADGGLVSGAELLERTARSLERADPARAARLLAKAVAPLAGAGHADQAERVAGHAKALVPASDPLSLFLVEFAYAELCVLSGRWEEGRAAFRAAACRAEQSPGAREDATVLVLLADALDCAGLHDRARETALKAARDSRRDGAVGSLTGALATLFSIEFCRGRIEPAAAAASEELEVAAGFGRLMEHKEALGHRAWCAAHSAQTDTCRALVQKRYELSERLGDDALLHPSLGVLELGLGNAPAAVRALRRTMRTAAMRGHPPAAATLVIPGELVEALLAAGQAEEARLVLEEFEEEARSIGRPHALSVASRCRGLLAGESFDDDFEAALAYDADEPRPLERARTILCWGMRLRRAKRRAEARAKLSEAYEELDRLGSTLWRDRAQAELAATGERPRRRDPSADGRLTEREEQVAHLVVEGFSNREVAERLFLSTNTIETHLRHIFQKVGVRSRTELARKLTSPELPARARG